MGAITATLSDPDEARAVLRYAREHNLGKIILGWPLPRRWRFANRFHRRLSRLGPDVDLLVVILDDVPDTSLSRAEDGRGMGNGWRQNMRGALAATLCALITLVCQWLPGVLPINLVMIYLLGVVLIAIVFGRLPSVVAALLNIVAFNLFFVAPAGSFAVSDAEYLVTFTMMLAGGLLTGNLTAGVRYQARGARHGEQRESYLYEMADDQRQSRTSACGW